MMHPNISQPRADFTALRIHTFDMSYGIFLTDKSDCVNCRISVLTVTKVDNAKGVA